MRNVDTGAADSAQPAETGCVAETVARVGDHLPYAIAILRAPDFRYEYINSHYQAIAPGKEFLGRTVAEVWPEVAADRLPLMRRVMETGLPFHECNTQYNLSRSPGAPPEPVVVTYAWIPVPAAVGCPPCLLAIGAVMAPPPSPDLHHLQRAETVRLLAAGIAHDFNNLLTIMLGYAWLGLAAEPPGTRAGTYFAAIRRSAERAATLTQQMLAYAGQGRTELAQIQISHLATDTLRLLRHSLPKHIQVELELVDALPLIEADPHQIEQVITNLVLNAVEAIGEAPGVVTVRTFAEDITELRIQSELDGFEVQPGIFVCLEVADTGSGIDPANLPRIFEPFFTTRFAGRGLGLAAVDGIVRACQGAIQVFSTPGQGSCFRLHLPAVLLAASTETTGH